MSDESEELQPDTAVDQAPTGELPADVQRGLRTLRRIRWAYVVAVVPIAVAEAVLAWAMYRDATHHAAALGMLGSQTVMLACVGCYLALMWAQRRAARRVARAVDVRTIGPLVQAVAQSGPWGGADIRKALGEGLLRMGPGDYRRLTNYERRLLRSLLTARDSRFSAGFRWMLPYRDLQLSILKALQQCGGQECVASVDYVARRSSDRRVREAARESLEYLQARLDEERPTAKLLRPAEPPEGVTLLRPAQASVETPEEQLLRPASKDGPED